MVIKWKHNIIQDTMKVVHLLAVLMLSGGQLIIWINTDWTTSLSYSICCDCGVCCVHLFFVVVVV